MRRLGRSSLNNPSRRQGKAPCIGSSASSKPDASKEFYCRADARSPSFLRHPVKASRSASCSEITDDRSSLMCRAPRPSLGSGIQSSTLSSSTSSRRTMSRRRSGTVKRIKKQTSSCASRWTSRSSRWAATGDKVEHLPDKMGAEVALHRSEPRSQAYDQQDVGGLLSQTHVRKFEGC